MDQILSVNQILSARKKIAKAGKRVVLVGGCFDILHIGHVTFLEKAKQQGDLLFVFLESDKKIQKIKGGIRPINNQADRAKVLSALSAVDYVILLPEMRKDEDYDDLVKKLNPHVIATTKGDKKIQYKKRSAKLVNAKIAFVTGLVKGYSTRQVIQKIEDYFHSFTK